VKTLIKKLVTLLNTIFYLVFGENISAKKTQFYLARLNILKNNSAVFTRSEISKSRINISGEMNLIEVTNALLSNTTINISGTNNKVIIAPEVKLRGSTVHIRGNNCILKIGKGTSFGGIRIVNAGENNAISIGQNCLFADYIELWASDTHTITNDNNEKINPEKPITIGDRVWVGSHAIILKGVTINNDSVIGMGTLVTKDVPPFTISAGSPNRTIKEGISWKLEY
jgi:acetyltransferase-like isoleucine patch superfamily enzyme